MRREVKRKLLRYRRRRRILLCLQILRIKKQKLLLQSPKQWQVRPIFQTRGIDGNYYRLVPVMRLDDMSSHQNYFRMSPSVFDELLELIKPYVDDEMCLYRNRTAIPSGLKLALTLRYLASGDSMISMSFAERTGRSTVSKVIRETCNALWLALRELVLPHPDADSFVKVADGFLSKWNFPNCMGSIDGKHVTIQAPGNAGSAFFNYKKSHSIVLMAVCDAEYCFTCVGIGAQGRQNDARTFSEWDYGHAILNGTLPLQQPIDLFGYKLPPVFVADEAFPLRVNIMRPFPNKNLLPCKRIYNYRLSRGRRTIENTFGILAARWRIFRKPIIASEATVDAIVRATVVLHNFLQRKSNERRNEGLNCYCPAGLVDRDDDNGFQPGLWRDVQMDGLRPMRNQGGNNYARSAAVIRDEFMRYFNNEGRVDWQDNIFNV